MRSELQIFNNFDTVRNATNLLNILSEYDCFKEKFREVVTKSFACLNGLFFLKEGVKFVHSAFVIYPMQKTSEQKNNVKISLFANFINGFVGLGAFLCPLNIYPTISIPLLDFSMTTPYMTNGLRQCLLHFFSTEDPIGTGISLNFNSLKKTDLSDRMIWVVEGMLWIDKNMWINLGFALLGIAYCCTLVIPQFSKAKDVVEVGAHIIFGIYIIYDLAKNIILQICISKNAKVNWKIGKERNSQESIQRIEKRISKLVIKTLKQPLDEIIKTQLESIANAVKRCSPSIEDTQQALNPAIEAVRNIKEELNAATGLITQLVSKKLEPKIKVALKTIDPNSQPAD